jgi:hypothetical protein
MVKAKELEKKYYVPKTLYRPVPLQNQKEVPERIYHKLCQSCLYYGCECRYGSRYQPEEETTEFSGCGSYVYCD